MKFDFSPLPSEESEPKKSKVESPKSLDSSLESKGPAYPSLADAGVVGAERVVEATLADSFGIIDSSWNPGSPAKGRTVRDSGVCLSNTRNTYVEVDLQLETDDLEESDALEQVKGARRQLEFPGARGAIESTLESELRAGNVTRGFEGPADLRNEILPIEEGSTLAKPTNMSFFQQPTNHFKKFTGAKGELSPRVWIKKFERVSIALGWNDEVKLNNVGLHLEGAAEKWFENSCEVEKVVRTKDWTSFKTLFIERFKARHNLAFLEEKLRTRKQQHQEQALDYFDAITDLINAIQSEDLSKKYSTGEKIKIVVNGLNEFLREKMLITIRERQLHGEPPLSI